VRSVLTDTGRDPVEDEAYRNLETVYRAFTTIGEIAVPTIAAVRGAAVGAGLNLALATDLRVVSRTARLLPGFAQIGIHPGGGHFTLLNRVAGREAAAAMGLFGEEADGDRAVSLGLAWAAYDDAEVEDRALALAARVAKDPALARRMVATFRRETAPGGLPWDVAVELERSPQMWSLRRRHGA
jgi:enoyl-CoA hydratase